MIILFETFCLLSGSCCSCALVGCEHLPSCFPFVSKPPILNRSKDKDFKDHPDLPVEPDDYSAVDLKPTAE